VVVDMGLLVVVLLFVLLAVVVAVGELGVVVRMRVPVGAVLEVVAEAVLMVMTDVPVIVGVLDGRMGVGAGLALAVGALSHRWKLLTARAGRLCPALRVGHHYMGGILGG